MISILIPTFGRADRLENVSINAHSNTKVDHEVVFIIEREDEASRDAIPVGDTYIFNERKANYAGAINTATAKTSADVIFMAADDLNFHPGWDEAGLALLDGTIKVVGTNDLGNPYVLQGLHSTHSFVSMDYINNVGAVWDEPTGVALFEGYDHNYVDTELVGTARARGVFSPCLDSIVEHLHYAFNKAQFDPTYDRGNRESAADEVIYVERKARLWAADGSQGDVR